MPPKRPDDDDGLEDEGGFSEMVVEVDPDPAAGAKSSKSPNTFDGCHADDLEY
jgi:hypothetical protein